MNLRDEMQYDMFKVLERYVKPGIATRLSKVLAQDTFNSMSGKWRQLALLSIETMTEEKLKEMGYEKKNDTV